MSVKQYFNQCLSWLYRFKNRLLPLVLLISLVSPVWAHKSPSAIDKLNQHLKQLHTLQAKFRQVVKSQDNQILQRSSGKVVIKRPNHFKWHIQKPQPQTIITDGQNLWIYQPDLKQVTQRRLQKNIGQIPLLLLTEQKVDLQKNFQVQNVGQNAFKLSPKKQASFAYLRLQFADQKPKQMTIVMKSGQQTQVQLNQIKFNQAVHNKQFQFQAPQDVQIINMNRHTS